MGSLLRGLAALRGRPDGLAGLAATLSGLRDQLPSEARLGPDGFDPGDPDTLARLLEEVEQLLVPRLMGEDRR